MSEVSESNELWGSLIPQKIEQEPEYTVHEVEDYRVSPQRTLDSHYTGFKKLSMVMYVQRVDFIVALFDEHGIESADIIIGDSVVTKHRTSTEPETFLRLSELIQEGKLTIRVPKKIKHFMRNGFLQKKKANLETSLVQRI